MRRARFVLLALALGAIAGTGPVTGSASAASPAPAATPLKPLYDFTRAIPRYLRPNTAPTGANDWACKPTAEHPRPVVLVHGTGANMAMSWQALSPELKNRGYCVFALNYGFVGGVGGMARVSRSARELAAFVDRVLAATGASKVDLVGHSQGGMMPRQYMRFEGGGAKVGTLVGLAPSNHGAGDPSGKQPSAIQSAITEALLSPLCGACADQTAGSPFLRRLNAGHETEPSPRYVVITTRYDEIVTPYTSALLTGANATNLIVQDGCEIDHVDHAAIAYDRRAIGLTLHALDPNDPAPVPCTAARPWIGG